MSDTAIKIENLRKQYRLGTIGGNTLNAELQSWWARKRGKEDPNLKIGQNYTDSNESFWALDGINLEVKKGEALGIIGTNGAGKSTLLKLLSRVTAPTEGDIWINGRISSMLEVGTGFHQELTGRENIYMNGAILGMTKKEVDEKIESIIDFSECREFIDTPVKRYSSGMYVKLAFAVASHLDSEILVMDEVLAVGDMKFQKKCLNKMGDVAENEGKTVLYVSHNMATIRSLCTRCIVLNKGKIIFDGDVETAIQIYMDRESSNLDVQFDFTNRKRDIYDLGLKCAISQIDLFGKNTARYSNTEEMKVMVKWQAFEDLENVKMGISIKYADGTNIGFAEAKNNFSNAKKGEHLCEFCFDLKNLADGLYMFYLQLFTLDEMNGIHGLDQVDKVYFEVVNDCTNEVKWLRQYWGNIRFKQLEIREL